ncbi:putative metalloprotease CJM1_0395 family protein [Psychromonas sp. SA13A]|uniref:putative metalloprotease CJM1_0395 family protein n=1 Tax=Psychromonas sp. SA13A TaxID=2686346 RepID=UPI00140DD9CB|nr:putative metalloprotease CJM1_0395 family protein [Psychromonas sp. SA13A]
MNISAATPLPISMTTSSKMASNVVSSTNISSETQSAESAPMRPNIEGFSPSVSTTQASTYQRATIDGSIKSAQQIVTPQQNKESSHSDPEVAAKAEGVENSKQVANTEASNKESNDDSNGNSDKGKNQTYSEDELAVISSLKTRHNEVNIHEQAHAAVGGQYASSPSYSYQTGPDGVKYAVSGEVSIDTSAIEGDPEATLKKAQQVKAAALAPAQPSAQDIKVAAEADQMATQARSEISAANRPDSSSDASNEHSSAGSSRGSSDDSADTQQNFTDSQNIEPTVSNNQTINNDKRGDKNPQIIRDNMIARSLHINNVYQSSSISSTPYSSFNVQV